MSDRIWTHTIKEGATMLRHGRAFLTARHCGRRTPHSNGQRQDLSLGAEWRVFPTSSFGFGWRFKWGTNASETTPDLSLHLSRLGDLWLQVGGLIPYSWLERHQPDGKVDYDTRVFGFTIDKEHIEFSCWDREGSWSRGQPWWWHQYKRWDKLILGPAACTDEIVDSGTCIIPMPEANYPATWERHHQHWMHTRWTGRLRDKVLGLRSNFRIELTPGAPVAVPGKGENSWDCGDDAFYSMSIGGQSVEHAIGEFVSSVLSTRRRHGGQHMSVPKAAS